MGEYDWLSNTFIFYTVRSTYDEINGIGELLGLVSLLFVTTVENIERQKLSTGLISYTIVYGNQVG